MHWIILAILGVIIVFLFFRFIVHRKEDSIDQPIVYICDECGEQHCICHREDDIK